jgi:hypothetical protein
VGVDLPIAGGWGGGTTGGGGVCAIPPFFDFPGCGGGGTETSGGSAGQPNGCFNLQVLTDTPAEAGSSGHGGDGGVVQCTLLGDDFGDVTGGGGGGGWFGGGGGRAAVTFLPAGSLTGAGGGGSGHLSSTATDTTNEAAVRAGNGLVTVTFELLTPPNKEACKYNGWHGFVDDNGNAFANQGRCVDWALHNS